MRVESFGSGVLPPAVRHGRRDASGTSEKFGYIDTLSLLPTLEQAGFSVMKSTQVMRRRNSTRDPLSAKHLLRLRRTGVAPLVSDVFPEIVLINAHDGTTAFQLLLGLFRTACANGLVVQDAEFAPPVRLVHTQANANNVLEAVHHIGAQARKAGTRIIEMQSRALERVERLRFAEMANDAMPTPLAEPQALLNIRRIADAGKDLWTTLNVVQENILRGGIYKPRPNDTPARRRFERTRPISAIDTTVKLNTRLWDVASEFLKEGK